jgi:hypothetical protein
MQLQLKLRVSLQDVFDKNGAFKDDVFKADFRSWFRRSMPSFPMPLLGETDYERWEIIPPHWHEAKEVDIVTWECPSCGDTHTAEGDGCCFDDDGEGDDLLPLTKKSARLWFVINTGTDEWVRWDLDYVKANIPGNITNDYEVSYGGLGEIYAWESESEVADVVAWLDREYQMEHGHEDMNGFPWSRNTGYLPESWVDDASLIEAGFTVANYTTAEGYDYRIAGLDGGGYDSTANLVRLFVDHCIRHGVEVHTKDGYAEMMPEGAA